MAIIFIVVTSSSEQIGRNFELRLKQLATSYSVAIVLGLQRLGESTRRFAIGP
jgi:hypothetical protein